MSEQDDQTFLKRFSLIIAGLAIFAVLIVVTTVVMNSQIAGSDNPMQEVAKVQRIAPVFDVYAGDEGLAAAQAVADAPADVPADAPADEPADEPAEAPAEKPQQQMAAVGSQQPAPAEAGIDGERIYNEACQACHMAGAAGAPQLVAAQWTDRLEQGKETLVSHAINGIGVMPAKGGRTDLSDEQVRASVEYMLTQIE